MSKKRQGAVSLSGYRAMNVSVLILIIMTSTVWGMYYPFVETLVSPFLDYVSSDILLTVAYAFSSVLFLLLVINMLDAAGPRIWPVLLAVLFFVWGCFAIHQYGLNWTFRVPFFNFCLCVGILPYLQRSLYRPLTCEPDVLGRRQLYRQSVRLIRDLVGEEDCLGSSIAVYGRWGLGKTHFVDYLSVCLSESTDSASQMEGKFKGRFMVSKVNLWRCHSVEEAWDEVTDALLASITGHRMPVFRKLSRFLHSMEWLVPFNVASVFGSIMHFMYASSMQSEEAEFVLAEYMNTIRQDDALLLVLDNIDRCDYNVVMSLFSLMERLKQVPRLVVICCIAREELSWRIREASAGNEVILQKILDKLFDVIIELPASTAVQNLEFMKKSVDENFSECRLLKKWLNNCKLQFDTPRQIQRVAAQLSMYEQCYLQRLLQDVEDRNSVPQSIARRAFCVFYMETMRLLYPSACIYLGGNVDVFMARTGLLVRHPEMDADESESDLSQEEKEKLNKILQDAPIIGQNLREDFLFRSLLVALNKYDRKSLAYALGKDCTTLCELTNKECERVVKKWCEVNSIAQIKSDGFFEKLYHFWMKMLNPFRKNEIAWSDFKEIKVSPFEIIREEFSQEYKTDNENALYYAALKYALNRMNIDPDSYIYVMYGVKPYLGKKHSIIKWLSDMPSFYYLIIWLKNKYANSNESSYSTLLLTYPDLVLIDPSFVPIDEKSASIYASLVSMESACLAHVSDEVLETVSASIFINAVDLTCENEELRKLQELYHSGTDEEKSIFYALFASLVKKSVYQILNEGKYPMFFVISAYIDSKFSQLLSVVLDSSLTGYVPLPARDASLIEILTRVVFVKKIDDAYCFKSCIMSWCVFNDKMSTMSHDKMRYLRGLEDSGIKVADIINKANMAVAKYKAGSSSTARIYEEAVSSLENYFQSQN